MPIIGLYEGKEDLWVIIDTRAAQKGGGAKKPKVLCALLGKHQGGCLDIEGCRGVCPETHIETPMHLQVQSVFYTQAGQ